MKATPRPSHRFSRLTGWTLVGGAALAPLLAWLGPLGFAPLMALMGLLSLPALRLSDEDRSVLAVLCAALLWAAISTLWSPWDPKDPSRSTALKLALQLPLYYAALCGARRADASLARRAMRIFAFGMTGFAVLLIAEVLLGGRIYRTLHDLFYEPIRPDLAAKNLGQSTFVLALLWPLAAWGAPAPLRPWFAALMAAAVGAAGLAFGSDAPVLSLLAAGAAGFAVWCWPRGGPRAFATFAAMLFVLTPALILALRALGLFAAWQAAAPTSWAMRMGYWSHAVEWIAERPIRGLGLDASRMLGPGIRLHPHDGALQVWLELGLPGAVAAATFWGLCIGRLTGPVRNPIMAAAAASAAVYLLFGALNFGIWQEWWLALGVLIPTLTAALSAATRRAA